MSNLPISSKYRSTPLRPVTDQEREALAGRLNGAYADGLVESEVYQGLLSVVFEARTLGELIPVVEVLPPAPTYDVPEAVEQRGLPGELSAGRAPAWVAVAAITAGILATIILLLLLWLLLR